MLCHFQNKPGITASHFQGVENRRKAFIELDVHDGTDNSYYTTIGSGGSSSCRCNIVSACKIIQTVCALEIDKSSKHIQYPFMFNVSAKKKHRIREETRARLTTVNVNHQPKAEIQSWVHFQFLFNV